MGIKFHNRQEAERKKKALNLKGHKYKIRRRKDKAGEIYYSVGRGRN